MRGYLPSQMSVMSSHARAISLMKKIMYQCRPEAATTLGQCRSCQASGPGGMECARCLAEELAHTIGNRGAAMQWLDSFMKVQQDEQQVFRCAHRVDASTQHRRNQG